MPLHKAGYRKWEGQRVPIWLRWQIITFTGMRVALKSRWVRRIMFVCWLPVMYWGVGVFVLEQYMARPELQESLSTTAEQVTILQEVDSEILDDATSNRLNWIEDLQDDAEFLPDIDELAKAVIDPDTNTRNVVWSWLLMTLFRYPQGALILFLLGFVTPSLISRDVRSRAFLLYFSRPIGRFEYILGKFLIPGGFVAFVTCLPALVLYAFGIMLSPDFSVVAATWDIPFRVLLATVALVLPTASIALMLSSLTQESRFATFAWFAIWILGTGAWFAILLTNSLAGSVAVPDIEGKSVTRATRTLFRNGLNPTGRRSMRNMGELIQDEGRVISTSPSPGTPLQMGDKVSITVESSTGDIEQMDFRARPRNPFSRSNLESPTVQRWSLISLYNNLVKVQSWIFGFESFKNVWPSLAVLFGVTLFSFTILYRRVSAPIRV